MKKKKTKWDFLAINRRLNQNYNGSSFLGYSCKNITKGEELKLNLKEHKKNGKRQTYI